MEAEPDLNESVLSNATGREATTAEGIAITYTSLFVMALMPLFIGSVRSVGYHTGLKVYGGGGGGVTSAKIQQHVYTPYLKRLEGARFFLWMFRRFTEKSSNAASSGGACRREVYIYLYPGKP